METVIRAWGKSHTVDIPDMKDMYPPGVRVIPVKNMGCFYTESMGHDVDVSRLTCTSDGNVMEENGDTVPSWSASYCNSWRRKLYERGYITLEEMQLYSGVGFLGKKGSDY